MFQDDAYSDYPVKKDQHFTFSIKKKKKKKKKRTEEHTSEPQTPRTKSTHAPVFKKKKTQNAEHHT